MRRRRNAMVVEAPETGVVVLATRGSGAGR